MMASTRSIILKHLQFSITLTVHGLPPYPPCPRVLESRIYLWNIGITPLCLPCVCLLIPNASPDAPPDALLIDFYQHRRRQPFHRWYERMGNPIRRGALWHERPHGHDPHVRTILGPRRAILPAELDCIDCHVSVHQPVTGHGARQCVPGRDATRSGLDSCGV